MSTTPEPPPGAATPQQQIVVVERKGNGLGVAGFVCGLIGAIFGLIPLLFWISFPLGVLGLVFGGIGWRRAKRERSVVGRGSRSRLSFWERSQSSSPSSASPSSTTPSATRTTCPRAGRIRLNKRRGCLETAVETRRREPARHAPD